MTRALTVPRQQKPAGRHFFGPMTAKSAYQASESRHLPEVDKADGRLKYESALTHPAIHRPSPDDAFSPGTN
jgi:hypothetical protein